MKSELLLSAYYTNLYPPQILPRKIFDG